MLLSQKHGEKDEYVTGLTMVMENNHVHYEGYFLVLILVLMHHTIPISRLKPVSAIVLVRKYTKLSLINI